MSWEITRLSNWSSAGGVPVADLGFALEGTEIRREIGERGGATLVLDADIAWEHVADRAIVRITRHDRGDYVELRCIARERGTRGPDGTRCTVTAYPRIYDLADSDLVRETIAGRTIFTFNQTLTARQFLERFFLANQATDGLQGIVLGAIDFPQRFPLQWERWTRGQLLDAVLAAVFGEVVWRYLETGEEELDIVADRGASAPVVPLLYGDRLADHRISEDYSDLATATRLAGEAPVAEAERATFGENAWRVASLTAVAGGLMAVELREITGTRSPIFEDGQYAAAPSLGLPSRYLQRADGVTRLEILASNAANSTVTVVATSAPTSGERVSIVANASGDPLERIDLPVSIARYGLVVADQVVPGGRGERQYGVNAGHEAGLTGWASVNGGLGVDFPRSEMGVTLALQANASRPGGTSTATPFAVKGLTPITGSVRRTDRLEVAGAECDITVNAIPDAAGALALTIASPGLPGSYADNDPITLVRRETRTLTAERVMPRFGGYVVLTGSDLAPLTDYNASNDLAVTGPNGEAYLPAVAANVTFYRWPGDSTKCVMRVNGGWTGGPGESASGIHAIATIAVVSAVRLAVTLDPTYSTGAVGSYVTLLATLTNVSGDLNTLPPWLFDGSGRASLVGLVVSNIAGVVTIDLLGLPAGASFVGIALSPSANWYPLATSPSDLGPWVPALYSWPLTFAIGAAFTVVRRKETRTLRFNGSHALAQTALTFKPIAAVARRDWVNTDILYARRELSATLRVLTITDLSGTGFYWEVTFDAALSTLDDVASADRDGQALVGFPGDWSDGFFVSSSSVLRLDFITGTTAYFVNDVSGLSYSPNTPPFTTSGRWTVDDSYAVTAGAAWADTGLASVPVSIPSGRTLTAGAVLWSNWMPSSETSLLRVASDVTGPAAAISVRGDDAYTSSWDQITAALTALYRVFATNSVLDVPGAILHATATVFADGSGNAAVPVAEVNANAIPNNAAVRIVRPVVLTASDRQTGSLMRLVCAPGGIGQPVSTTPGMQLAAQYFRVPAGSTRTITARTVFRLSIADWFAGEAGSVAIVNEGGTILGWSALGDDGVGIDTEAGQITIVAQAVIAASGRYGVRVYGGPSTDLTRWVLHDETMFYLGEATDAPYTTDSYASQMLLGARRVIEERAQPRIGDTLTVQELSTAYAQAIGVAGLVPPLTVGGRVHLEEQDRLARVTVIVERPDVPIAQVQIGQVYTDGTRLLGQAALTAGLRGLR